MGKSSVGPRGAVSAAPRGLSALREIDVVARGRCRCRWWRRNGYRNRNGGLRLHRHFDGNRIDHLALHRNLYLHEIDDFPGPSRLVGAEPRHQRFQLGVSAYERLQLGSAEDHDDQVLGWGADGLLGDAVYLHARSWSGQVACFEITRVLVLGQINHWATT